MTRKAIKMGLREAKALHTKAHAAGMESANACIPTPMRVVERINSLDDNSPIKTDYGIINEGMCGFGWVEIRPSRGGLATYLKKNGIGRYSEYERAWMISSPLQTQSYERNMAYASAYSKVLQERGINSYANGRLD